MKNLNWLPIEVVCRGVVGSISRSCKQACSILPWVNTIFYKIDGSIVKTKFVGAKTRRVIVVLRWRVARHLEGTHVKLQDRTSLRGGSGAVRMRKFLKLHRELMFLMMLYSLHSWSCKLSASIHLQLLDGWLQHVTNIKKNPSLCFFGY